MSVNQKLRQIGKLPAPMRLLCFIGVLSIFWLPLAIPLFLLFSHDSNFATIVTMSLLFAELLILWRFWGKVVHQENQIFRHYGLEFSRINLQELLKGLAIGFCLCLSLFMVEALLGWIKIIPPSVSLIKIILEGLLSGLGIALAEELLFRGWLLDELARDYSNQTIMGLGGLLFAIAHFIKPPAEIIRTIVTFPALILLGIILILAKRKHRNRLGICIGLHGGLVWAYYIINVGKLVQYQSRVPVWITGIDHNPIAGVMGLLFLSGLLLLVFRR